jgi:hypothetical protein
MMDVNDKLSDIFDIIKEIGNEDKGVANILMEGFGISINIIEQVANDPDNKRSDFDLKDQINMVSESLGFSLDELVLDIVSKADDDTMNKNKEADEETLDFITADVDDYEEFLKENSVKDDLEFLKQEI